jgi:large subunit ribosomal protein L30
MMAEGKQLKVTLKRSVIGRRGKHRKTIQALGLRKINQTVVHKDNPQIRGMLDQVGYLLEIEEIA